MSVFLSQTMCLCSSVCLLSLSSTCSGAKIPCGGDKLWRLCDRWLGQTMSAQSAGGFLLSHCTYWWSCLYSSSGVSLQINTNLDIKVRYWETESILKDHDKSGSIRLNLCLHLFVVSTAGTCYVELGMTVTHCSVTSGSHKCTILLSINVG